MYRVHIKAITNLTSQDESLMLGVDRARITSGGDLVTTEKQCAMHSNKCDSLFRLFNQLSDEWCFPISQARYNSIYVLTGRDPDYRTHSFDNHDTLRLRVSAVSGLKKLLPADPDSLSSDVQDSILLISGIKHLLTIQNQLRHQVNALNAYSGRILILGPQNTTTQRPEYFIFETLVFGNRDRYTSPRRVLKHLNERIYPVRTRAKPNVWQDLPIRDYKSS